MRGQRARIRPEDHLADNPGQLSPGRPDLLTSPVERCRSRPARTRGAGPARLHYVGREDPGNGHRNRAAERPQARRGTPHARIRRTPNPARASRSKPQIRTHSPRPPGTLRNRLTYRFLRRSARQRHSPAACAGRASRLHRPRLAARPRRRPDHARGNHPGRQRTRHRPGMARTRRPLTSVGEVIAAAEPAFTPHDRRPPGIW